MKINLVCYRSTFRYLISISSHLLSMITCMYISLFVLIMSLCLAQACTEGAYIEDIAGENAGVSASNDPSQNTYNMPQNIYDYSSNMFPPTMNNPDPRSPDRGPLGNRDQGGNMNILDMSVPPMIQDASTPNQADQAPPLVDECADAGNACDVCTCRLCAEELNACLSDPACESVLLCAQRTGCGGIDCLNVCGDEIDAAGGAFGAAVGNAQAVGDCREDECGETEAECLMADPGPPVVDMGSNPQPLLDQGLSNLEDQGGLPTPNPNGCESLTYEELCATGQTMNGEQYCEVFAITRGTCTEWCAQVGGDCIDGWDERGNSCERDENHGCDDHERDQICRCVIP